MGLKNEYEGVGLSTVTYEVEETDNTYNEVSYDSLAVHHAHKVDLPLVTGPSSKQPIKPSLKPEKPKGSPITMVTSVHPACPERLDKNEVSSPKPQPFVLCEKEKFRNLGNDVNIDRRKKIETPVQSRKHENIVSPEVLWDRTRIQENLGMCGTEEGDTGDIYQDVTIPAMVLVSELETYIQRKKNGQINELANEFDLISAEQLHPWNVASKEKNKAKNRFRNILAYDHSRVVLKKVDGDPHSDYYNANYINDFRGERTFIASQAPNTASLTAFWRMIWQENVTTIVMLTKLMEAGKDRCRQYWPKNSGTVEVIGDFCLTLMEVEQFSDHTVRTVIVKMAEQGVLGGGVEERRTITQYHYSSWPDMGVPEYCTTLVSFTKSVNQHYKRVQSTGRTSPLLVHCCAGVGRTGTFVCLYNMLDMMKEEGGVDIYGFISRMRDNRFKMVQKKGQYVFLYNALLEAYLSGDTEIPAVKFREVMDTAQSDNSMTKREFIHLEFETLRKVNPSPPTNSFRSGRASSNQRKNRFPDVLPLESNRPYLLCRGLEDSTDYINASFINTFLKRNVLLATQSPLPNTVVDLWRLVIDWKCPVIVMLNELDGESCVQYWPEEESTAFGPLQVTALESGSTVNFVKRKFCVTSDTGQCINVEQFQMRGWGVSNNKPDSPLSLIKLIEAVEGSIEKAESKGPAIVHCINGIGRSGVFCALWSVFEKLRKDDNVDIFQAVQRLRSNRPRMVESLEQYELCHEVVNEYLHQFEEYANVDTIEDRLPSI
nr:receptor-type tyrosine-protein phosphatase kappa-like [Lytechinus pictus]